MRFGTLISDQLTDSWRSGTAGRNAETAARSARLSQEAAVVRKILQAYVLGTRAAAAGAAIPFVPYVVVVKRFVVAGSL
jgi:hypothetical protein